MSKISTIVFEFFFFFKFKISQFAQKESYNHKIDRQGTLGFKLQKSHRICRKTQHLLIFDDFGKICDFPPNFRFSRLIFEILKFWETDKLKNKYFHLIEKFMEIIFHILNNVQYSEMDEICVVKPVSLWGTQRETVFTQIDPSL